MGIPIWSSSSVGANIDKIVSNKTPSYLKKLPRLRKPLHSQNNSNTFQEISCKSLRMSSFFPDAITSWNNVIAYFDYIPSLKTTFTGYVDIHLFHTHTYSRRTHAREQG